MAIQRGDVIQLGPHRLMCGDSTNQNDVRHLFSDNLCDIVFTSPPYLQQRVYGANKTAIMDWKKLVVGALCNPPAKLSCQVLVNIGMCHSKGEWTPYWEPWLGVMRNYGWRRFGFYVWDTNMALPGHAHGRLPSRHEFIFHLNKQTKFPNKIIPTKHGGKRKIAGKQVAVNEKARQQPQNWNGRLCQKAKPLDSIITVTRSRVRDVNHPAKFPQKLVSQFLLTYSEPNQICYDPFVGSGTTFLACEDDGRRCLGIEIEPDYCQIAVDRYWRHKEKQKA